jgi:hypothetical protein
MKRSEIRLERSQRSGVANESGVAKQDALFMQFLSIKNKNKKMKIFCCNIFLFVIIY